MTTQAQNKLDPNALRNAIIRNNPDMVLELLNAGADVNERGYQGYTPIMLAISWHLPELVEILYNAGANVLLINDAGKNAIKLAKEYNNQSASTLFKGKHV